MFFHGSTINKSQKMPNYDVHAKHHFFMPNHFKKAKLLEFGLKNANLPTLTTVQQNAHKA